MTNIINIVAPEGRFTSLTFNGPATTHDGEPAGGEWAATLTGPLAAAVLNWTEDRGDEALLPALREYVTERFAARYDLHLIAAVPHGGDTVRVYFVVS